MKRLVFFLAAIGLISAPATAQEWTVGDQGINWSVLSTKPVGAAPADAYEPAEPPLPTGVVKSEWLVETSDQLQVWSVGDPKNTPYLVGADSAAKAVLEKKIRITCEPALPAKRKDNILGYGVPSFGHIHLGTGAIDWDENSDYTSLRLNPTSSCSGGPLNATNYMEPALLTSSPKTGAEVVVLPQSQSFYYIEGDQDEPNEDTWLRRGMQFILGTNPMNYNDAARRAIYDASGFEYPGSPDTPAGFTGYYCIAGDGTHATVAAGHRMKSGAGIESTGDARYLKGPSGEDPFAGTCTGTEESPAELVATLTAPECWDRTNLTSPDGRGHFWYRARKPDNSVKDACPTTASGEDYGRVPQLTVKNIYETTGFAEYGTWYLGSDRMPASMTVTAGCTNDPETQGDPCSLDPCRQIGPYFCNGSTLHADYTFGWETTDVFDQMERECLGIPVRGIAPTTGPAECNASQVDRYHVLEYGPSPDPAWTGGCTNILGCHDSTPSKPLERYHVVPDEAAGDVTIEHRH